MLEFLLFLLAYLLGSLSTAIITCKLMGLPDPRTQGSHNPGATNVLRLGGKKAAAITLLGDALKGVIPVLIAQALDAPPLALAVTALGAFLGHLYPIFFRFQGGKGVATAFGVLVAMTWPVGVAILLTWLTMALLFKISSLSALTAAILAPLYMAWLRPEPEFIAVTMLISILLIWRHRSNIRQLLAGTEDKIK
jgi:glycerol-3-phosphate acyltransferase PlsY